MKKQNILRIGILLCLLIVITVVAGLFKIFYVPTKTYHSAFLKIRFDYPVKYELEERFGTITLKKKNEEGEIILTSIGTNYTSLDDYIKAADKENKLTKEVSRKKVIVYGWEGLISDIKYPGNSGLNHKGYSFYREYTVYGLYTRTPSLYPDLDRIAKTFRYEP